MKEKIFGVLAVGCLLTLVLAAPARAQEPDTALRASIPFDFIVRGRTLPAGNYEIRRIGDEPIGLIIRNVSHTHDEMMFPTEPVYAGNTPRKSLIVFHRYGDSYFLSEIVTGGSDIGRELAPSHSERMLRRDVASNKAEPETVALALN